MADLSAVPWNKFPTRPAPADQVSRNFRFYELTRSELAARLRIDNLFAGGKALRSAVHLCRAVLQPLREEFGRFTPNSVYRSQALERALKKKPASWTSASQHTTGEACDVEIPGMATLELARWISRNLGFDQLILECFDAARGPSSGWVHVSLRAPGAGANRRELLSYVYDRRAGRYAYLQGLRGVA
ncbi:MAG: D-Ala-D-Ala carboxypeptidase family metallohydrolase [Burkholderiales bacterium]